MKRIVEFPLDGGGSVYIESDEPELAGTVRIGRADGMPEKAKQTFEQSLETVRTVAGALLAKVDELTDRPDELQIEFGIKLSGEIGADPRIGQGGGQLHGLDDMAARRSSMSVGHDQFVVRIRSSAGQVVGAGFLAGERLVITCAHVVAAATDADGDATDLRSVAVSFDFPLLAPGAIVTGRVVGWVPMTARGGDIAILEVIDGLPRRASPARLVASTEVWGHAFRAFGFPAGHDDGVWAAGVLRDRQGGGWVQVDDVDEIGYRVQQGFSGGPVFDETLDGVVGMAVAAEASPETRSAWLIPTETLVEAWPQLATRATPACPYPGLRSFRESDAATFYGRRTFVHDRLLPATRRDSLVAIVVGASGAGKSSVVYAGLFPALPADEGWQKRGFRPGTLPFDALAAVLVDWLGSSGTETDRLIETRKLGDSLLDGGLTLAQVVDRLDRKAAEATPRRYLLFIDQFEELFGPKVDPDVRRRFVDALVEAIALERGRSTPRLTVMLAMRADFMFQALAHRPFSDLLQDATQLLGPMTRDELRDAIVEPAAALDVTFQDGLVDRILDDVGDDPGRLPLLQFALSLLWAEQSSHELTHAAYERIGEVSGALVRHAGTVFGQLTVDERELAHRLFVQLVQPGTLGKETRRVATRSELSPREWDLAQRLSHDRLVVVGSNPATGVEFVDLIHETLINAWPQLRAWVDTDREFRIWQEGLRGGLGQWEASGRDPGFLIRGGPLVVAEGWLERSGDDLVEDERLHIVRSIDHRRAEQEARGRTRRLLTLTAIGTSLVFLVLTIVAGWQWLAAETERQRAEEQRGAADEQREVAEQQRKVALSRQLAAQAGSQRRLDRALLLSLEANRFSPTVQAKGSLLTGLMTSPRLSAYLDATAATVQDVAFSPDGTLLASAGDREVILWDVASRARIGEPLQGHADVVISVAFSPDGRTLASAGLDERIILWEVASRTPIGEPLEGHADVVNHVAFSPDGLTLASAGADGSVRLWDVTTRTAIGDPLEGHTDSVMEVAFSPDGTLLASAGDDGSVRLWDVTTRTEIGEPLEGHTAGVRSVAFSPDGTLLASAGDDYTIILWDAVTRVQVGEPLEGHTDVVSSVVFRPDGETLASASDDGTVILWDVARRTLFGAEMEGHGGRVASVTFNPDGRMLASAGYDTGTIILWELPGRARVGEPLERDSVEVAGAAFSPDGSTLATAGYDGEVILWDVAERTPLGEALEGHADTFPNLAFSPDGVMLASAGDDGIYLWDVAARARVGEPLGGPAGPVPSFAFSPDGSTLATVSTMGIILWDVADRALIGGPLSDGGDVASVTFSPDGTLLASGEDEAVILWDVAGRSQVGEPLERHSDLVLATSFSPDGTLLASAGYDQQVILWDTATRRQVGEPLEGHRDGVWSVAFSPDGKTLASAGMDAEIILWDVASRTEIGRLVGPASTVWGVAFSPAGALLASGGDRVMLWDIDLQAWEATACQVANRNLDREEWRQYVGTEEYHATCPGLPVPAEPRPVAPSPRVTAPDPGGEQNVRPSRASG